eukprot:Skav221239  [mRNA]  locus=scaffold1045:70299:72972:+ [translate_table: standard]
MQLLFSLHPLDAGAVQTHVDEAFGYPSRQPGSSSFIIADTLDLTWIRFLLLDRGFDCDTAQLLKTGYVNEILAAYSRVVEHPHDESCLKQFVCVICQNLQQDRAEISMDALLASVSFLLGWEPELDTKMPIARFRRAVDHCRIRGLEGVDFAKWEEAWEHLKGNGTPLVTYLVQNASAQTRDMVMRDLLMENRHLKRKQDELAAKVAGLTVKSAPAAIPDADMNACSILCKRQNNEKNAS